MTIKRRYLIIGGTIVALSAGGAGVATAVGGGEEAEKQATGPGADRAKAAALKLVPGGTANAVERDGEKGATWEVEVRKPDGSTVDVRLGSDYQKVAIDGDSETADGAR